MDEDRLVVAQFEKNSKEEVRVSIDDFHGRKLIHLRVHYKDGAGEWQPGRQGIALSIDHYKDLADAFIRVGEELQAKGLLGAANVGV